MSNSLLAALLPTVFGLILAYTAGSMGFKYTAAWVLVVGSFLVFLGVVIEGMSAYEAGRRDREAELDEEMMGE